MQYVILALVVVLAVGVIGQAVRMPASARVLPTVKMAGGLVVAGLALLATGSGRLMLAVPLGAIALALLLNRGRPVSAGGASGGASSSVRTAWLEMMLDHENGTMAGRVLQGRFIGRELGALGEAESIELYAALSSDAQSRQLMEAWLERSFPDWRDHAGDHGVGADNGAMTVAEAYAVLGLTAGASNDEIAKAHRDLMKKFHPDQGGSTYMATKLNAAKDLLLGG